ncbi:zinc-binding metallopeptidase family protein [Vannielia sp. SX4]|uniref:zinc-binding metallopeptidase family protein n=1 Tax=Vannielia sp. SX4 TaxID=3463852 RepID=UPI0040596746
MQIFHCPTCSEQVWFHNHQCPNGHALHFDPDAQAMVQGSDCERRAAIGCNWSAHAEPGPLCRSCAMTAVIPDPEVEGAESRLARTEAAKRWVLAGLHRWGWFGPADPGPAPRFELVADRTRHGPESITMGHADGVITLDVAEASRAVQEERRERLAEDYRTMIGHLRHELAHYLFLRLSTDDPAFPDAFRALFGDERADYGEALKAHYANPRPAGGTHITSYATAHPHEDWAETVAHLLHLTDLVDSGYAVALAPGGDAYAEPDAQALIERAANFAMRVNHVNRALDLPDLYPFVLSDPVRDKLAFAHGALRRTG